MFEKSYSFSVDRDANEVVTGITANSIKSETLLSGTIASIFAPFTGKVVVGAASVAGMVGTAYLASVGTRYALDGQLKLLPWSL